MGDFSIDTVVLDIDMGCLVTMITRPHRPRGFEQRNVEPGRYCPLRHHTNTLPSLLELHGILGRGEQCLSGSTATPLGGRPAAWISLRASSS